MLVLLRASTLHGDGLPFKPCRLISHATSRTILFELSKETLFPIATVVAPQASPCILPGTLMTLVSHRGRPDTQDSGVHFYAMLVWPPGDFVYLSYSIIQKNVTSAYTEESSPFQLSSCPSCYTVNAPFIVSCAPPPFINLRTRFFLRGRDVTPRVTESLIKLIKLQLSPDARLNQYTKYWNQIQRQRFKTSSSIYCGLIYSVRKF
jgi:hypothetical protein